MSQFLKFIFGIKLYMLRPPAYWDRLFESRWGYEWMSVVIFFIIKSTRCTNFSNLFLE